MGQRVVVGMSGGVDSSVAALLLKEQGYDVVGVTMQIWQDEEETVREKKGGCCGLSAVDDAANVAEILDIPYYVMNFKREFQDQVIDYFSAEYLAGRTPNPCIACNRYVKWESLLIRSRQIGADYIATGHYARIERLPSGRYVLRKSVCAGKDQTYVLYSLSQEELAHTLLPAGKYTKSKIREIAQKAGLPVYDKPDSQEICFIPDGDYASFIEEECRKNQLEVPSSGNFVDKNGKILGQHKGITHYTVGQRRGLGIAEGKRMYVTAIRPEQNEVVLGEREDLLTEEIWCDRLNFMSVKDLTSPKRVLAKIRYNHAGEYCRIEKTGEDRIHCLFEKPVFAAAPGQAVVFYDGEYVLGGGTITEEPKEE